MSRVFWANSLRENGSISYGRELLEAVTERVLAGAERMRADRSRCTP